MLLCFLLAAVLTGLDQAVKAWTVGHFTAPAASFTATADPAQPLLPGIVELTRVHNYGAAWSNFSGMRWFLSAVTAFAGRVLPFYSLGMGWIVPACIGFLVGLGLAKGRKK